MPCLCLAYCPRRHNSDDIALPVALFAIPIFAGRLVIIYAPLAPFTAVCMHFRQNSHLPACCAAIFFHATGALALAMFILQRLPCVFQSYIYIVCRWELHA